MPRLVRFLRVAPHSGQGSHRMTAAVYPNTPSERPGHAIVLQVVIAVAALLLIAATWVFTEVSMNTEAQEARARVEGSASNLALAVEWRSERAHV